MLVAIVTNLFVLAFCAFIGVLAFRFPYIFQRQMLKGMEKNMLAKYLKFPYPYIKSNAFLFMTRMIGIGAIFAALYNLYYLLPLLIR